MIRCRLPEIRARKGRMTITSLATQTGIAASTLSRLETGKTKGIEFATLEALCRFFGVEPGELFEMADTPAQPEPATVGG